MLVEFKHVRSSSKEMHEKSIKEELHGAMSVPFCNEEDYVENIVVDIDEIQDFAAGRIWLNDTIVNCVYYMRNDEWSPYNLVINYEDFKTIMQMNKGKIHNAEELIKLESYGSNTEGI